MTRINVGVKPQELNGRHLIAEHREIKRIPNLVKYYVEDGIVYDLPNIPDKFTLGKGHVTFFYNKLGYLLNRYKSIYEECLNRGYNVTNYENAWEGIPLELMNDYIPSEEDRTLIINRINERLNN